MTKQEIYDKVCRHLAKQKGPAVQNGVCVLRTHNGKRCAVGCFIEKREYKPEMEDLMCESISTLCNKFPSIKKRIGSRNYGFIRELQLIHDDIYLKGPDMIKKELLRVANRSRLKTGSEQRIKVWKNVVMGKGENELVYNDI